MPDQQMTKPAAKEPPPPKPSPPPSSFASAEAAARNRAHYPNPPDLVNPDAATLRDQWRFAIRQYSRWYSQAWGTAILAGVSFFALGWLIKGSNPLPSRSEHHEEKPPHADAAGNER
ncbi:uncharacterized protein [Typha angustifolia]|uniref:uncharacterized protein n=1 Tax=Typha angustifolia TaxID=59011 RepID=UPI003C2B284E